MAKAFGRDRIDLLRNSHYADYTVLRGCLFYGKILH
jgi:hypothetical protein